MPFFNFDDLKVYYNVNGNGFPLLLLHGNSVSSVMFTQEIEFYSQFFKVIVFDYPGHGKSDRADVFKDNFWQYNAFVANALLELLGIDQTFVIGTSGGALVGLNLSIQNPDKIIKLISDSFLGEYLDYEEALAIKRKRTKAKKEILTSSFWESMHGNDWSDIVDRDLDLMVRVGKNKLPLIYGNLSEIKAKVLATASEEDELIPDIANRIINVIDKIPEGKTIISKIGKHPFMITQRESFRDISLNFLMSD